MMSVVLLVQVITETLSTVFTRHDRSVMLFSITNFSIFYRRVLDNESVKKIYTSVNIKKLVLYKKYVTITINQSYYILKNRGLRYAHKCVWHSFSVS